MNHKKNCASFSFLWWPRPLWVPLNSTHADTLEVVQYSSSKYLTGNSLAVQWLRLGTVTAVAPGSIPGQRTKIPQTTQHGQKKENKGGGGDCLLVNSLCDLETQARWCLVEQFHQDKSIPSLHKCLRVKQN